MAEGRLCPLGAPWHFNRLWRNAPAARRKVPEPLVQGIARCVATAPTDMAQALLCARQRAEDQRPSRPA